MLETIRCTEQKVPGSDQGLTKNEKGYNELKKWWIPRKGSPEV